MRAKASSACAAELRSRVPRLSVVQQTILRRDFDLRVKRTTSWIELYEDAAKRELNRRAALV